MPRTLNAGHGRKKATVAPTTLDVTEAPTPLAEEYAEEEEQEEGGELKEHDEESGKVADDDFYLQYEDYDYSNPIANATEIALAECLNRPSSKIRVSQDDWTSGGRAPPNCTFPFAYKGKVYYSCTDAGNYHKYWCANSCHFSDGRNLLYRGTCDIPKNHQGVLGTGIGLNAINVFVGFLFAVGSLAVVAVLVAELCRRRGCRRSPVVGLDEHAESQKMVMQ